MFCTKCGAGLVQGAHFCLSCGQVVFRPAETSPATARSKDKSNPLLSFGWLVLIILMIIGIYALVFISDKMRFGFTLWTVYVFETLTGLFALVTLLILIFLGFKNYVLSKLRHPGIKPGKFLSKLSRKFSRHK